MSKLSDSSVNLIFTSPPYPILGLRYGAYEYKGDFNKYLEWLREVFVQCARVLRDGGYLVVNFDNPYVQTNERPFTINRRRNVFADFDAIICGAQLSYADTIIWDKMNAVSFLPTARNERSSADVKCSPTYEFLNIYRKGATNQTPQSDGDVPPTDLSDREWYEWRNKFWRIPSVRNKGNHICPFPLEIAERVVRMYSYRLDTCLDPFVGSGTTAAAAVLSGRNYIGIDNDELSVTDARKRVEAAKIEAKAAAGKVADYLQLHKETKAADVLKRLQTVQKHKRKQINGTLLGKTVRNRPVEIEADPVTPKALGEPPT